MSSSVCIVYSTSSSTRDNFICPCLCSHIDPFSPPILRLDAHGLHCAFYAENIAPVENSFNSGARLAPPDSSASISSSENSSRPYVAGITSSGSAVRALAHPSLPKNLIDGTRPDELLLDVSDDTADTTGVGAGAGAAETGAVVV